MTERTSNRRIRLLLCVFVLVFAGTLGRAVWLQGVQAGTLERMAPVMRLSAPHRDLTRTRLLDAAVLVGYPGSVASIV